MPPKKAAAVSSTVYVVVSRSEVASVHAAIDSATKAAEALRVADEAGDKDDVKVQELQLIGGTISITPAAVAKPVRAAAKHKVVSRPKPQPEDEEEEEEEEEEKPASRKSAPAAPPVEKPAKAGKPKKGAIDESKLPENVRRVLSGSGGQLAGKQICVTGVPPTIGRKNAEKIVVAYGGKLMRALSKKTDLVVVGNDAGPKK